MVDLEAWEGVEVQVKEDKSWAGLRKRAQERHRKHLEDGRRSYEAEAKAAGEEVMPMVQTAMLCGCGEYGCGPALTPTCAMVSEVQATTSWAGAWEWTNKLEALHKALAEAGF